MNNKVRESKFYKIVRPILKFLFLNLYRPKIIGSENIPKEGRVILAGNHTNNFDCVLLMSSTKRCIHFLAKVELFKGFKKVIFSNLGLIPVDRSKKNPDALKTAKMYLENDMVIGIFPEGTFSKKGELLPFKIGAVKMAYDTDTKIVPFAITGKYKLFSKNLKITFGKPLSISSDLDLENNNLRDLISKMVGDTR